ncbi:MAG: DUF4956 domain-containing protein, partial [Acidimicrobiia bacterium]|nr:DUF4956 domain-containing protein [Acidimicrobiia bacterium]
MSEVAEVQASHSTGDRRSLALIALYYAALFALLWLAWTRFPEWRVYVGMPETIADPSLTEPFDQGAIRQVGLGVLVTTLVGVLVTILPVAWSYIVIKRRADYDQSIVHTLIILPITIAGIVLIVQNSLALAFSLAGIVAGVRFRTTLKDVKDGVYVFLAIGVGLACGVQAIGVALAVSFVFNVVNILLWRVDFGNIYADQGSRTGALQLGDVLAGPGSARTAVRIGDKRLLQALSPIDLREVAEKVARLEQHIASENVPDVDRKSYSLLIVHSESPGEAQKWLEAALQQHAARWRLAEISPGNAGVSILQYLVRLR